MSRLLRGLAMTAVCALGVTALVAAPLAASAATPASAGTIRINEVDSQPADWVEFFNPGTEPLDISGYEIRDDSDDHRWQFAPGTTIGAGAFLVVDEATVGIVDGVETAFRDPIGIGSADRIRLFDRRGAMIDDTLPWNGHAAIGGDSTDATLARCPDGEGPFVLAHATPGKTNDCVAPPVAINEIESKGDATDWVEVVNTGTAPVDISGWSVMDSDPIGHAGESTPLPAGTMLDPGAYFVFDQPRDFTFGLGGADTVTLRDAGGSTIDEHVYSAHAKGTWSRCADGTGSFTDVATSTKGAANSCAPDASTVAPWPGSQEVRALDTVPTFLQDSSGLDVQETADGAILWGIDNGEGRLWKLKASADGSFVQIPGWEKGKRIRFQKDASDPAAKGPDTEGVTVDADGFVYAAAERDNSNKGVNHDVILKVDPESAPGDLIAQQEWDLTSLLPAVGANLGIESVEWVPDTALAGKLFDDTTGAAYRPTDHPGHGTGLFFVALEDNGHVYAFALGADGHAQQVAEIAPGLAGVMALDYDSVLNVLWAVCDNGCQGRSAQIMLNGTATPTIAQFARPTGMPDINNEGFATAPASLSKDGVRPVWWFADGFASEALRAGTLPGAPDAEQPGDGGTGGEPPVDPGQGGQPGGGADAGTDAGAAAGSGSGHLAVTGAEPPFGAIALAVILLLAGAGALVGRRRQGA